MKKEFLFPPEVKFPKNLAPSKLSHAVKTSGARDTIHVSGQVSSDEHGEIVGVGDLEAQIHQVFKNLEKVSMSAGGTLQDVVLLNAFMKDISRIDVFRALRDSTSIRNTHPPSQQWESPALPILIFSSR